jgi:imidazolonepropionase-like amidohydrolase
LTEELQNIRRSKILLKIFNAQVYSKGKLEYQNGWVEIQGKKIIAMGEGDTKTTQDDINAEGKVLISGFIDAHTHLGIMEDGLGFEGDDCNEQTDPFSPHLRTIDGINPFDYCFKEARKRGITTVVVSPGSANPVAGQMVAIKTYGKRIDDMLIKPIGMKFALGENPKQAYNDRSETPTTRMATVAIIREGLYKAKRYLEDVEKHHENPDDYDLPEYDIKSEALIPLLKREIKAHFHCHRADDICTAIRISKEFNLDCVIVHGTEGYLISDIIAEENVPVICGPVICDRCKPEMKGLDIKNASVLSKDGVKVAICTDHSVIPIQYLPTSVLMAIKGGLSYTDGLKAITSNPAEIIGIGDIVGDIAIGMDADLQLYDGDPLNLTLEPTLVMIDGKIIKD